jgi:hypothetical protein
VPCAQATSGHPPAGASPFGQNNAPDTAIGVLSSDCSLKRLRRSLGTLMRCDGSHVPYAIPRPSSARGSHVDIERPGRGSDHMYNQRPAREAAADDNQSSTRGHQGVAGAEFALSSAVIASAKRATGA